MYNFLLYSSEKSREFLHLGTHKIFPEILDKAEKYEFSTDLAVENVEKFF